MVDLSLSALHLVARQIGHGVDDSLELPSDVVGGQDLLTFLADPFVHQPEQLCHLFRSLSVDGGLHLFHLSHAEAGSGDFSVESLA